MLPERLQRAGGEPALMLLMEQAMRDCIDMINTLMAVRHEHKSLGYPVYREIRTRIAAVRSYRRDIPILREHFGVK